MTHVANERIFAALSGQYSSPASDLGRRQFIDHQSRGIVPQHPEPYFVALSEGKWMADYMTEEYRRLFIKGEWWGLYQLWLDWTGKRFVLPYLLSWYSKVQPLPSWIAVES